MTSLQFLQSTQYQRDSVTWVSTHLTRNLTYFYCYLSLLLCFKLKVHEKQLQPPLIPYWVGLLCEWNSSLIPWCTVLAISILLFCRRYCEQCWSRRFGLGLSVNAVFSLQAIGPNGTCQKSDPCILSLSCFQHIPALSVKREHIDIPSGSSRISKFNDIGGSEGIALGENSLEQFSKLNT